MQKYHDEPKQYKGYLKSALARGSTFSATSDLNDPRLYSGGTTPISLANPNPSRSTQVSTILPFSMRCQLSPVRVIELPVGAIPRTSPSRVPTLVQRLHTMPPSATML